MRIRGSRETEWAGRTFIRELFLGTLALPLIHPFPEREPDSPEFAAFYQRLRDFLLHEVDSAAIDHTGEYPENVRESVRCALTGDCAKFDTLDNALMKVTEIMDIPLQRWIKNSAVLKNQLYQKRLEDFV